MVTLVNSLSTSFGIMGRYIAAALMLTIQNYRTTEYDTEAEDGNL